MMDSIKKLIRSVLMSSKEGVPAGRFTSDYADLTSSSLRPEKYGFKSLAQLMRSMPDVVRISDIGGGTTYHAVTSEDTAHIQKLISKQNSRKKKKKSSYKHYTPFHRFGSTSAVSRPRSRNQLNSVKPADVLNLNVRRAKLKHSEKRVQWVKTVSSSGSSQNTVIKKSAASTAPMKLKHQTAEKVRCSHDAGTVNQVILNRIKTILSENSSGVFSHQLSRLYYRAHDRVLPESVVHALEAGDFKHVARAVRYKPGKQEGCILYPVHSKVVNSVKEEKSSDKNKRSFCIDSRKNEMVVNDIIKNRIRTLLHEHHNGIPMSEFNRVYKAKYGSDISDSIIYGLECGQIKGLVKVEKRICGNREYVTFYPSNDGTVELDENEPNTVSFQPLPALIEKRVTHIMISAGSDELDVSTLAAMYADAYGEGLRAQDIESIKNGCLKEIVEVSQSSSGKCKLVAKVSRNVASQMPKYPGIFIGCREKKKPCGDSSVSSPVVLTSVTLPSRLPQEPETPYCSETSSIRQVDNEILRIVPQLSTEEKEEDAVQNEKVLEVSNNKENLHGKQNGLDKKSCNNDILNLSHIVMEKSEVKFEKRNFVYFTLPKTFPSYRGFFGKFVAVEVTRVINPHWFYMLPLERLNCLLRLSCQMSNYFDKVGLASSICTIPNVKNTVYAALCYTDRTPSWRRVIVKSLMGDRASVFMIDTGSLDCVTVKSICNLPQKLRQLPELAVVGRLSGIVIKQSCDIDAVTKRFEDIIVDRPLIAHAVSSNVVDDTTVFDVSLYFEDDCERGCYVDDLMVEEWEVADFIV